MNEQVLIGGGVAALCGLGLWHNRRLFTETGKGRWFARRFGEMRGLWILRGMLVAGVIFGVLLATDVIRPIRW